MFVCAQDAKAYCREIMGAIRQLRQKRDMSINEIKLTLAIEDPTTREKRDYLGIEVMQSLLWRIGHESPGITRQNSNARKFLVELLIPQYSE